VSKANNIVASGTYTAAGSYNLSFTSLTAGGNYKIEFFMQKANSLSPAALLSFSVNGNRSFIISVGCAGFIFK
jgi:hypothetical protein